MARIEEIEKEIQQLHPGELAAFRKWFYEFDAEEWDRQIKEDAQAGRLDKLAQEALEDHRVGRTREI